MAHYTWIPQKVAAASHLSIFLMKTSLLPGKSFFQRKFQGQSLVKVVRVVSVRKAEDNRTANLLLEGNAKKKT